MLLAHQHIWSEGRRCDGRGAAALPHPEHVELIRSVEEARSGSTATPSAPRRLRGGRARSGDHDRGGAARRLRARPPARPPRPGRARDGLLRLQQRRGRGARGAGSGSASSGWRSSTSTSTTATARRRSSATTTASSSSRCTSGRSTRAAAGRTTRRETTVNVPLRAGSGDEEYVAAFTESSSRRWSGFEPELVLVSAGFDAHARTRSRTCASPRTASASSRGAAGRCATGSPRCSRAATSSRRCRASSTPRSTASPP